MSNLVVNNDARPTESEIWSGSPPLFCFHLGWWGGGYADQVGNIRPRCRVCACIGTDILQSICRSGRRRTTASRASAPQLSSVRGSCPPFSVRCRFPSCPRVRPNHSCPRDATNRVGTSPSCSVVYSHLCNDATRAHREHFSLFYKSYFSLSAKPKADFLSKLSSRSRLDGSCRNRGASRVESTFCYSDSAQPARSGK